ncbi:MAG: DUF4402 domain-containing protein, partial [Candidatus Saccharimonadales bacterium]
PLLAQHSATANGSAQIVKPLIVTDVTELDYGNVIVPTATEGSGMVTLQRNITNTGDDLLYNPSDMDPGVGNRDAGEDAGEPTDAPDPHTADFHITGQAGLTFHVTLPGTIALNGGAHVSPNVSPTSSVNGGTIPPSGSTDIYVGGVLNVTAGTALGEYEVPFTVTVNYD